MWQIESYEERTKRSYANNEVPTNWGTRTLNPVGEVDEHAQIAFTRGQCHSFALALHKLTGWPIFGIGYSSETPGHFVVYCPETDDYLDIDGAGADERYRNLFSAGSYLFTAEEARNCPDYLPCFPEKAELFARTVLDTHRISARYQRHLTAAAGV